MPSFRFAMAKKDPRVDTYVANSADFAKPILKHFRKLVHEAAPEIEEAIKWSMPAFVHKGIVCGMAAFKNHAVIHFWKGDLIFDGDRKKRDEAMGDFGRLTSLDQLPSNRLMIGYIRKAVELNELGVKKAPRRRRPATELSVPDELQRALNKNKQAREAFDQFSYSHRKEYIDWITSAKRDATRARRVATAMEWMSQGKPQNWKYMRAPSK
jgi:uncharacterized protein YdeI (YjbR/CyaY-like superfamily)